MGVAHSITLPEIYSKLTLGNIEAARAEIELAKEEDPEYQHIINLSGMELTSEKITVHDLPIDDKESLTFGVFSTTMLKAIEILSEAEKNDEWVLVNCMAGCNRSVSAIVCYAVLRKGWKLDDAIEYIKFRKRYIGKESWNTLGNVMFHKHLKRMEKNEISRTTHNHIHMINQDG
jgi:protein-tyrosine phosphatase